MSHKIKVRVTLNSGKAEKIGFHLEDGEVVRLNGEVPGMAILAALVGDPQLTVFKLTVEGGALVVSHSSNGAPLVFNDQACEQSKVRQGDKVTLSNGSIEFLDCPAWVEPEESTRMVTLESSDATRVMVNPDATKFVKTPLFAKASAREKTTSGETIETVLQAKPSQKDTRTDFHAADSSHYEEAPERDDATSIIMGSTTAELRARHNTMHQSYTDAGEVVPEDKSALWKHIAQSVVMIGVFGEIASLVAFGSKFAFSPIPTPLSALILIALFSAISAAFFYGNRYLGTSGKFETYLRSFAWFSMYLLPFSFAFAFPTSVVVLASTLLGIIWIGMFSLKFFGQLPQFIPISGASWIFLILGSFYFMGSSNHKSTHAQEGREIAGTASAESSPLAPVPAVSASALPVVVVAPAAPAPVAKPMLQSTEELARQATSLGLDPLAQEQFFNGVKSGNLNLVTSMIERHVIDPVFTLDHGSTALHFAAAQGDLRMAKYLVSQKVNIDAQDAGGTTALMWAAYKHKPKVVEFLLQKKANMAIRREGGDRVIEIARSAEDKEIVALLKAAARQRKIASMKGIKTSKSSKKRRH